jgi:predicted GNAT family acetyltransferase
VSAVDVTGVRITDSLAGVGGAVLKQFYIDSDFDNGRTAEQHETAFRNSIVRLAFDDGQLVGAARAITDGVRCAAVFDVCVRPSYRRRGIATRLVRSLVDALGGQFVLLTCDAPLNTFYARFGFGPLHANDIALAIPD